MAFRAGESFTPSPVMATTSPCARYRLPMRSLSSGVTRANILIPRITPSSCSSVMAWISSPVRTSSSATVQPRLRATETAVPLRSPVMMTTFTPCPSIFFMARGTSGRTGSKKERMPEKAMCRIESTCTSSAFSVLRVPTAISLLPPSLARSIHPSTFTYVSLSTSERSSRMSGAP
ncbi:MAG: hypothetical protein WDN09_04065 [bacterium]